MELKSFLVIMLWRDWFHMICEAKAMCTRRTPHVPPWLQSAFFKGIPRLPEGEENLGPSNPCNSLGRPSQQLIRWAQGFLILSPFKSIITCAVREETLIVNTQQDSSKAEINSPWIYMGHSHPRGLAPLKGAYAAVFIAGH